MNVGTMRVAAGYIGPIKISSSTKK